MHMSFERLELRRGALVLVISVLFLTLISRGLWTTWRPVTLVAIALILNLALLYELSNRNVRPRTIAITLCATMAIVGIFFPILNHLDPPNPVWSGPLVSAGLPTPSNACTASRAAVSKNGTLMLFGSAAVVSHDGARLSALRVGTCPMISFFKSKAGLLIDGAGYDSDDNLVYRIKQNKFEMVLRGFLKLERPDKSTFLIVDDIGREALFVRFINDNTIKIRGTFRCGDIAPVKIGDAEISVGGKKLPLSACKTERTDSGLIIQ